MMRVYAYKEGSASAKALAQALGIKRVKHTGKGIAITGKLINWGASKFSDRIGFVIGESEIINSPDFVARASDKVRAFHCFLRNDIPTPDFTVDSNVAYRWWCDGHEVVIRKTVKGHSGQGIVLSSSLPNEDEAWITDAPLYTLYIPKSQEYRIHVFQGDAFFVQRKARKKDVPDEQVNWKIRNHQNGFIFAHNEGVDVGAAAKDLAVRAVATLGLDFGAVDIIQGKKDGQFYVLEVNTACGLEGETLKRYVEKFQNL